MKTLCTAIALSSTAIAMAQTPKMGGPMKHIAVEFDGITLAAHVDPNVPMPELQNYGETYTGNAAVLNGTFYNKQYGWMVEGFWAPPAGSSLWIRRTSASPDLLVYSPAYAPILGTGASPDAFAWSGTMLHNWYATTKQIGYFAETCEVYFADAAGVPTPGFAAAPVALEWFVGCLPDCEADADLDIFDFLCFQGKFADLDAYADFEHDGDHDFFDFLAFQNAFAGGC